MTLQEAVASGLKFKRPIHQRYSMDLDGYIDDVDDHGERYGYCLTTEDIMATDWMLEPTRTLTATDLRKAANKIELSHEQLVKLAKELDLLSEDLWKTKL